MTLIHVYDEETGKLLRSQEPALDPLETQLQGHPVYAVYYNSTEIPLPEYGEHEAPFFNKETQEWEVKGQYKNLEVYNKKNKSFEYCYTEELGEDQVWIDDKEGIEKFKKDFQKYVVNEDLEIVENPKYELILQLRELESKLSETDSVYETLLDTPVVFPVTGKLYKPRWTEDGTYANLITAKLAGLGTFPIDIWDATKLEENKVSMDEATFGQLCAFLVQIQRTAFDARKNAQAALLPQIDALKAEIGE